MHVNVFLVLLPIRSFLRYRLKPLQEAITTIRPDSKLTTLAFNLTNEDVVTELYQEHYEEQHPVYIVTEPPQFRTEGPYDSEDFVGEEQLVQNDEPADSIIEKREARDEHYSTIVPDTFNFK